jgi:hypothetical protein
VQARKSFNISGYESFYGFALARAMLRMQNETESCVLLFVGNRRRRKLEGLRFAQPSKPVVG